MICVETSRVGPVEAVSQLVRVDHVDECELLVIGVDGGHYNHVDIG